MPKGVYKRKPLTKQHRENLSKACKGKKFSKEHKQKIGKANKNNNSGYKHGGCGTKIYGIWHSMKSRCLNLKRKKYGAKGITICSEWLDKEKGFINFKNWALSHGYNNNLEIHRKKNHLGYSPTNCEWITLSKHRKWHWALKKLKERAERFLRSKKNERYEKGLDRNCI